MNARAPGLPVIGITAVLAWTCTALASESPWAQLALSDLDASHRLLAENHPGTAESPPGVFAQRLESGLREAKLLAARAASFAEYQRSMQRYMNEFQDNHVHVALVADYRSLEWPGFVVVADDFELDSVSIRESVRPDAPDGARLLACDGRSVIELLQQNVFRFRTIREIPHARIADVPYLFVDAGNPFGARPQQCEFAHGDERHALELEWERISRASIDAMIHRALGNVEPPLRVARVGEGFLLSIPSFDWWGASADRMQTFLEELRRSAPEIRAAGWLTIDVRGNEGGNSEWGNRILSLLWSPAWLQYADSVLDDSVAWRASTGNIAALKKVVRDTEIAFDDASAADYWRAAVAGMESALMANRPFYEDRDELSAQPMPPDNPMKAAVYFLTDHRCASACLNFADLLLLMPQVRHVGLPTAADTTYIDVRSEILPSGLARLFIAMKVYTDRKRGSNEWYEPAERWPGGSMTDEAIIAWIRSLQASSRSATGVLPERR